VPTVPEEFAPLGRWTASVEWTRRTSTPVKPQTRQDISSIGWMPDCRREAAAAGFASERDPLSCPLLVSSLIRGRSFDRREHREEIMGSRETVWQATCRESRAGESCVMTTWFSTT
jgi:hypothetical protein